MQKKEKKGKDGTLINVVILLLETTFYLLLLEIKFYLETTQFGSKLNHYYIFLM
jgi:hypothetical protein